MSMTGPVLLLLGFSACTISGCDGIGLPYPGADGEVVLKVNNRQLLLDGVEIEVLKRPEDSNQGLNKSRLIIAAHVCTSIERLEMVTKQARAVGYEQILMDRYGSRSDAECD